MGYFVEADIRKAETLPAEFYRNPETFERIRELIFNRCWHFIGDSTGVRNSGDVTPISLYPGFLEEPMLLTRDEAGLHCLSNVCTHRGNLIIHEAGSKKKLTCMYHGRKFGLDGSFEFMPEFSEADHFPRDCEHLPSFPLTEWGPFLFAGLSPKFDLKSLLNEIDHRLGFLPFDQLKRDDKRSQSYSVKAHWALYCDNYLEGFHIPYVHDGLNQVLDYGDYETVLGTFYNLQIGYADGDTEVFQLPDRHPDAGKKVAAYYFWLFPNMMFNIYPWGISVNVVRPVSMTDTVVDFISYVWDASKIEASAGAALHQVEMEDECVVEGVQRGLQSRYYSRGRFSPTREQGVHQFHRLLAEWVSVSR